MSGTGHHRRRRVRSDTSPLLPPPLLHTHTPVRRSILPALNSAQLHPPVQVLVRSANAVEAKAKKNNKYRNAKIAAAAVTGGALLAVTGGLAAPALAAALTATGVTGAVTLASYTSVTTVATVFGVGGATRAGWKMDRRTAGIQVSPGIVKSASGMIHWRR